MHLNGGKGIGKIAFYERKDARNRKMDRRLMLMKKLWPQGVVCPCPGALYMYITVIFQYLLLLNRLANQSQIVSEVSIGRGDKNVYK